MDIILKNYFLKNKYGRIYYNLKNRKIDYPPKLSDGRYIDSNNLYGYYGLYNIVNSIVTIS